MGRRDLSRLFVCLHINEPPPWSLVPIMSDGLGAFAAWFEALPADIWDRQIKADAKAEPIG